MSKHLSDELIDYALGILTAQEQANADAHLRECEACRVELSQHQALAKKLAATIPALLPAVPPRVRNGWADVAARIPQLRTAPRRPGLPGFVAVGAAMSTAAMLLVAVMAQAWLYQPPLTATAFVSSSTPVASATYTPEHPTLVATPVSWMSVAPQHAPRPLPIAVTAQP